MTLFFALLPADLHIDILQTWVGLGLSALSALDAAFCSRADRPHFLVCLQLACRHRSEAVGDRNKTSSCNDVTGCLSWMAKRGMVAVGLELFSHTSFPVPIGPNGSLRRFGNHQIRDLPRILHLSPEVKSIAYYHTDSLFGIEASADEHLVFWKALPSLALERLESLSFMTGRATISLDQHALENAFAAIGPRLQSLQLTCCNVLRVVATHCKLLQTFTCGAHNATAADIVDLLQALKHLSALTIRWFEATVDDVRQILRAGEQFKSFAISKYALTCGDLIALMREFPQLNELRFGENFYQRKERHLQLLEFSSDDLLPLDAMQWERTFAICPGIVTLKLNLQIVGFTVRNTIGVVNGPTIQNLTVVSSSFDDLPYLRDLVSHFANLIEFSFVGDDAHAANLKWLLSSCSKLQKLSLKGAFAQVAAEYNDITDVDMEELLAECPRLESMEILIAAKITKRTLEAILRRKMVFKALTFGKSTSSISQEDAAWFLEQAKELQLLPLPSTGIVHIV